MKKHEIIIGILEEEYERLCGLYERFVEASVDADLAGDTIKSEETMKTAIHIKVKQYLLIKIAKEIRNQGMEINIPQE